MSVEEWRVIPSEPGYEASNLGRIRNARSGRVLGQRGDGRGYWMVTLGHARYRRVNRLVCEAWHGPAPTRSSHADHIDWDKANNRPDNLRWRAAHLNSWETRIRGRRGWETEEAPEDFEPMTDAERAAVEADLQAAGW